MKFLQPLLPLMLVTLLTQCVSVTPKKPATLPDGFPGKYVTYRHVRVPVVKQSTQRSCGAAALSSVLQYWLEDPSLTEDYLLEQSPPESEVGYPIMQLRNMARSEGALAFGLTMNDDPMGELVEQLRKGRPIIAAVELPKGRYFGDALPLIETLDRRAISAGGLLGGDTKSHYVVVMGESAENILVMDPQYGIVHTPKQQFEHFWKAKDYAALLISAAPEGVQATQAPEESAPAMSLPTLEEAGNDPVPPPSTLPPLPVQEEGASQEPPRMRPSFREPEPLPLDF